MMTDTRFQNFGSYARCNRFKDFVRNPYAWPGGYALSMLTTDGGVLCHSCAKEEAKNILHSTLFGYRDGRGFEATYINWEDQHLYCDHCGNHLEPEYGLDCSDE